MMEDDNQQQQHLHHRNSLTSSSEEYGLMSDSSLKRQRWTPVASYSAEAGVAGSCVGSVSSGQQLQVGGGAFAGGVGGAFGSGGSEFFGAGPVKKVRYNDHEMTD
jgi:hypothetical protein